LLFLCAAASHWGESLVIAVATSSFAWWLWVYPDSKGCGPCLGPGVVRAGAIFLLAGRTIFLEPMPLEGPLVCSRCQGPTLGICVFAPTTFPRVLSVTFVVSNLSLLFAYTSRGSAVSICRCFERALSRLMACFLFPAAEIIVDVDVVPCRLQSSNACEPCALSPRRVICGHYWSQW
jgi:hypothetical protein